MTATMSRTCGAPPDIHGWLQRWYAMWNGELDLAHELIAPQLLMHLPKVGMPPPSAVHDAATMSHWIGLFRSSYSHAHFACELGPFISENILTARFRFTGTWMGGRPTSATAPPGTAVDFAGVDMLRFERGRVAEYWLTDDQLDLYAQVGAQAS
jgi:hypothetical protein